MYLPMSTYASQVIEGIINSRLTYLTTGQIRFSHKETANKATQIIASTKIRGYSNKGGLI